MKNVNLLKVLLFALLTGFLAVIPAFYFQHTSVGLVLPFFATVTAFCALGELRISTTALLYAFFAHLIFLIAVTCNQNIIINKEVATWVGSSYSILFLLIGLFYKVKQLKNKDYDKNQELVGVGRLVLLLIFASAFCASCNQTQSKQFCSELSQECELQKDFVVIKILQNNGNGVDAYGTPLRLDEWYLHSTKSGAVLPLEWNGMESSCVTPPELEKVLAGEKSYSVMEKIKQYKVDTLQNFGLRQKGGGGGISQVITKAILLETDGYFDVFNNGKGKYVTFRKQKEIAENPVTE